jgi:hypothetical protein
MPRSWKADLRIVRWFGGACILLTIAGSVLSDDDWRPTMRFPDNDEIERVVAECYSHPFGAKDVPQFEISKDLQRRLAEDCRTSQEFENR